jgi:hypothetical protein
MASNREGHTFGGSTALPRETKDIIHARSLCTHLSDVVVSVRRIHFFVQSSHQIVYTSFEIHVTSKAVRRYLEITTEQRTAGHDLQACPQNLSPAAPSHPPAASHQHALSAISSTRKKSPLDPATRFETHFPAWLHPHNDFHPPNKEPRKPNHRPYIAGQKNTDPLHLFPNHICHPTESRKSTSCKQ